eukprot:9149413-Pyramimonas_sp.AAC.1
MGRVGNRSKEDPIAASGTLSPPASSHGDRTGSTSTRKLAETPGCHCYAARSAITEDNTQRATTGTSSREGRTTHLL